jgi:hypothetical protein
LRRIRGLIALETEKCAAFNKDIVIQAILWGLLLTPGAVFTSRKYPHQRNIPVGGNTDRGIKIKLTAMVKTAAKVMEKYKFNNCYQETWYATTCK